MGYHTRIRAKRIEDGVSDRIPALCSFSGDRYGDCFNPDGNGDDDDAPDHDFLAIQIDAICTGGRLASDSGLYGQKFRPVLGGR